MTMRVVDVAPNEALLALLGDQLEGGELLTDLQLATVLEGSPAVPEAVKSLLREIIDDWQ